MRHFTAPKERVTVDIGGRELVLAFKYKQLLRAEEKRIALQKEVGDGNAVPMMRLLLENLLIGLDNQWNCEDGATVPTEEWLSEEIDARDIEPISAAVLEAMTGKQKDKKENPSIEASQ